MYMYDNITNDTTNKALLDVKYIITSAVLMSHWSGQIVPFKKIRFFFKEKVYRFV